MLFLSPHRVRATLATKKGRDGKREREKERERERQTDRQTDLKSLKVNIFNENYSLISKWNQKVDTEHSHDSWID